MFLESWPQLSDQLVEPLGAIRVREINPSWKIRDGVDGLVQRFLLFFLVLAAVTDLEQEIDGERDDDPEDVELVVADGVDDGPEAGTADEVLGHGEDLGVGPRLLFLAGLRWILRHYMGVSSFT